MKLLNAVNNDETVGDDKIVGDVTLEITTVNL